MTYLTMFASVLKLVDLCKAWLVSFLPLPLRVVEVRTKQFRGPAGEVSYAMTQIWLANDSPADAEDIHAKVLWRRAGTTFQEERPGLWLRKIGSEMAGHPGPPQERMTLSSNGEEEHLALLAKNPADVNAYIVAPGSYFAGSTRPNYKHPDYAVPPGTYEVAVKLRARGGRVTTLRVRVQQPGKGQDPCAEVI